uniref:Odorant receptor n=1 Tax=Campoletis chlorideae TaxID=219166 RepID=A0A346D409_9HYME|nr:odorant receptor [Campoletis chlorideae]
MKKTIHIKDKYEKAKDIFRWIERFFLVLGTWPLRPMNVRFTLWMIYLAIHFTFAQIDLYYVIGDLQLMVENITETGLLFIMVFRLISAKFSRRLRTIIKLAINFIDAKHFRGEEEWQLYLNYNRMAKSFFKIVLPIAIVTTVMFWFKPMQLRIEAALRNETKPYPMAYRVNYLFEIKDDKTFYLIWFYQAPQVYFAPWYCSSIGLLLTLVYHMSGQLSVLSFRVKNLTVNDFENEQTAKIVFQELAQTHQNIVELAKGVNGVFGPLLLDELLISTVLVGLTIYTTIMNADIANVGDILSPLSYGMSVILLIYSSCVAGEYLVTESSNLYAAYYECLWYDMPMSCKKQLLICMLGASRPIQLSAAGFYDYTMFLFISILKTAGGYISLLRTMTEKQQE